MRFALDRRVEVGGGIRLTPLRAPYSTTMSDV
jgi:hypothetical protein